MKATNISTSHIVGKTSTVIEAIQQMRRNHPTVRILACAPSDSAADVVCQVGGTQYNIPYSTCTIFFIFYPIQSCTILSCTVLSYSVVCSPVLSCHVLSCHIFSYAVLSCPVFTRLACTRLEVPCFDLSYTSHSSIVFLTLFLSL